MAMWPSPRLPSNGSATRSRAQTTSRTPECLTASEVLEQRVGLCYAKSHFLAAILRAEGIPTGLCYQRLLHGDGHVLHALVAIYLNGPWHHYDPRGNKEGVDARFSLDSERLAWSTDESLGDIDYPQVFTSPAPCVIETLGSTNDVLTCVTSVYQLAWMRKTCFRRN